MHRNHTCNSAPLLMFTLNFCLDHYLQTIKAINLKLHKLIEHIMGRCSAQEP